MALHLVQSQRSMSFVQAAGGWRPALRWTELRWARSGPLVDEDCHWQKSNGHANGRDDGAPGTLLSPPGARAAFLGGPGLASTSPHVKRAPRPVFAVAGVPKGGRSSDIPIASSMHMSAWERSVMASLTVKSLQQMEHRYDTQFEMWTRLSPEGPLSDVKPSSRSKRSSMR